MDIGQVVSRLIELGPSILGPIATRYLSRSNAEGAVAALKVLEQHKEMLQGAKAEVSRGGIRLTTEFRNEQGDDDASQEVDAQAFPQADQQALLADFVSEVSVRQLEDTIAVANAFGYALEAAASYEPDEQEKSDESAEESEVSDEWLSRWRRKAETIRDDEIQQVWGELLASEAAHPGSISHHTLEVLYALTPEDARLFAEFLALAIGDEWIPRDAPKEFEGLGVKEALRLEELGLIIGASSSVPLNQVFYKEQDREFLAISMRDCGIVLKSGPDELAFPAPILTRSGREIARIDKTTTKSEHSEAVRKALLKSARKPIGIVRHNVREGFRLDEVEWLSE